jgi:hypothetical protein
MMINKKAGKERIAMDELLTFTPKDEDLLLLCSSIL